MKHKLVIIEGPDRIGKDTILAGFDETVFKRYIQVNNPPDYRKIEEFEVWLADFLRQQANDLIKLDCNIIMVRLFTSDYVYSSLFNRHSVIYEIFDILEEHFDFEQIIITYKDYDQYVNRCTIANCELEYTKDEFDTIQKYYLNSPFNKVMKTAFFVSQDYDFTEIQEYVKKLNDEN
jgi:hypothetical protein